ncbi:MAG: hypothetical protein K0R14_576 [Burkholderiales bacterium]|jgi:hypothetical protein|nr:hypothetical protein [Burkholderiales bacterium]
MGTTVDLHNIDFYAWTQEQAKYLKEKALDKLDLRYLFEEIMSMGAREKSELKNRLAQLFMHLLKWEYQQARQCRSWQNTISDQREELRDLLDDNPSLKPKIDEYFIKAYKKAVREVVSETGLDDSVFPQKCKWTIKQVLDDNFLP